jgi:hypothetical protein
MGYHELPINDETMRMNRNVLKAIAAGRIPIENKPNPDIISEQIAFAQAALQVSMSEIVDPSSSPEVFNRAAQAINHANTLLTQFQAA